MFEGLSIWNHKKYRELQGTYPVISLSFASVKEKDYKTTRKKICQLLTKLYAEHAFLLDSGVLYETDVAYFRRVSEDMDDSDASLALYQLSDYLYRYYGKKVIILLDEYDTPMQEAYVDGFVRESNEPSESLLSFGDCPRTSTHECAGRDEMVGFTRSMFNAAFKTNPWLERGIMTGITRVSKESIFSDLNNLEVVTTTSEKYDVMLEPRHPEKNYAIIMEFKVYDPEDEKTLRDTVYEALRQIEQKKYAAMLIERGMSEEHIRSYGFAFQGKTVLIG